MYTAYYKVWYRHSGEEEIDDIPTGYNQHKIVEDVGEITTDIGDNYITHMSIYNDILPTLSTVAPQLTHLQIQQLYNSPQLEKYVGVCTYLWRVTLTYILAVSIVMHLL